MKKKTNTFPVSLSTGFAEKPSPPKNGSTKKIVKSNGKTDGKTDGKTNGKTNGKTDGKTNGKTSHNVLTDETDFTDQLDSRELLRILSKVRHGNFSVRMPIDRIGISGKICDTLNEIISLNETLVEELSQARNTIGKQGHLNHRVALPGYAKGSWSSSVDSINSLISDLVHPTIEIAHVISSVAKGNLSQEMP